MINKTLTFGLGKVTGYDGKMGEFIPLDDVQRKRVYEEIRKGFGDFARLCNVFASLLYTGKVLHVDIKELGFNTGYKPIVDKLGMKTSLNGYVLNQAWGLVTAHFAGEHGKKLMAKGESVLPTHRADGTHPLCFHTGAVDLIKADEGYFIVYHIFSDVWAKQEGLPPRLAFQIRIKDRDKTGAGQLDRIISGEWQKGSGQLVRNKRPVGPKYIMHLVVKYEPDPYMPLVPETVMGIDLGVMTPAAVHFRTNGEPQKWAMCVGNGRMLLNARGLVRSDIVRLLRALKRKDSPLTGHDRTAAQERLKELRQRERRLMKTASQKIAAQIADMARRNGAGIWQMEALSGNIKVDQPWLVRNWAPGMLIDAVRWQATQLGVKIRFVDPRYTSQRCSKCGHIDKQNRPKNKQGAAYFQCTACGYSDHADKNAARNLSIEGIEELISRVNVGNKVPNGTGGSPEV